MAMNRSLRGVSRPSIASVVGLEGGRSPYRVVEEFIVRLNGDPDQMLSNSTPRRRLWSIDVSVAPGESLEELHLILDSGGGLASEGTLYMGLPLVDVPLRDSSSVLVVALEQADSLVLSKLSLIGSRLIISCTVPVSIISLGQLVNLYEGLIVQRKWLRASLFEEFPNLA